MRVIFMGTPDFSVGILEEILAAGHEVVLVVTQPDKPKGRGKAMQYSPVKEAALAHGLEVYQPKKIREAECVEYLRSYQPDIMVVAAFGQILSKEILDMPRYCCLNVHASLLPKYRGAAPIQWAVINGDKVSGVTTMRMDTGIDTGDMIDKTEVILAEDETGGSLFDRLAEAGAKLCVASMKKIEDGTAVYTKQDETKATHVGMIEKRFGRINWKLGAVEIERLIRGLNPWPSAYTYVDGKMLKIWKASVIDGGDPKKAGCIIKADGKNLQIQTGDGILAVEELQLEGKKRMPAADFLRGYTILEGSYIDTES
ncbi:MAG: methionyl-tRNA formyltransferase [Lachnospiraceae bacterium]|nr:methionyl-tRNA formyltransferase [Lachnospiraceae bacterium]